MQSQEVFRAPGNWLASIQGPKHSVSPNKLETEKNDSMLHFGSHIASPERACANGNFLESPESFSSAEKISVPCLKTPSSETFGYKKLDFGNSATDLLICPTTIEDEGLPFTNITSSPLARLKVTKKGHKAVSIPTTICSTISFLDDEWLQERVQVDEKMAQVAAGFVKSHSETTVPASPSPKSTTALLHSMNRKLSHRSDPLPDNETLGASQLSHSLELVSDHMTFGSSIVPPEDYICKLCNIPGHWLRDCSLFEPHQGHLRANHEHSQFPSVPERPSAGRHPPPGNYICRLCGVPGHWIEQCSKFQPKRDFLATHFHNTSASNNRNSSGNSSNSTSAPPRNYVCNLCHKPGHWIQQCSEFVPLASHRVFPRLSHRSSGGSRFLS